MTAEPELAASEVSWLERLPKMELHLHLEGAIPLDALWELVIKYGGDPEVPSLAALAERFAYRDFPHFIQTWHWKNRFLREYEDFAFIARRVGEDLAAQGVRYAEVFFSPSDFERYGLEPQGLAEQIRSGLDDVAGVRVALVADLVRDTGPEQADHTLDRVSEVRDCGVVGIGLGGSEHQYPAARFKEVFAKARRLGFRTSAHAGEAAGSESVWAAALELEADRIGHATRAVDDPELVDVLEARGTPLELCPISNMRTGVIPSLDAHPVRTYLDRGMLVSVNTDDPKMFGNSLADEYAALVHHHGFTRVEIRELLDRTIRSAWLEADERDELRRELMADPAWRAA
jgi:adenosine deaminase